MSTVSAAGAEAALHEALGQSRLRLRQFVRDDDALARGQSVGLHHHRRPVLAQIGQSRLVLGEGGRGGGGNPGRIHHLLGEGLGSFQEGSVGARPEHGEAPLPQLVGQTGHQGSLRPDDREVDLLPLHEGDETGDVLGPDVDHQRVVADAGVARGAQQPPDAGALAQAADEGVLPGASADHQDVQPPSEEAIA